MTSSVVLVGAYRLVPPGENPFAPLHLDDPVGPATALKLERALADRATCSALLDGSALEIRPVPDRQMSEMCAFDNAVAIERSVTPYSAPVSVSCPLAATLYIWERDVLQPLAREHFAEDVARIEHLGSYSCRRVYGGRTGEPSQHATANALDVMGFTLDGGETVSVLDHWDEEGARGEFLHALHARSCDLFRGVLGPEYNDAHENHFHLDMGPYSLCR